MVATLQNYCRLLQHHRICLNGAPLLHFTIVSSINRGYAVQLVSAENQHPFRVLNEAVTTLQKVSDKWISEQILEVLVLQHRAKLHHNLFLKRREDTRISAKKKKSSRVDRIDSLLCLIKLKFRPHINIKMSMHRTLHP